MHRLPGSESRPWSEDKMRNAYTSGRDRIRGMGEVSNRLTNNEEHSSLATCDRPDAWLCELPLQETATESVSTTAVSAASTPLELASQAGLIATSVADPVCGVQTSANSGPISDVAAPVEALGRLHVRASYQGFLPIQVDHYFMLLDWTGRELHADKRGVIPEHLAPIVELLGVNPSNLVETVRGFGRLFKQAAGRSSLLVDAAARCSRRWFQGKEAARMAFL
jgi:hypothetical protein